MFNPFIPSLVSVYSVLEFLSFVARSVCFGDITRKELGCEPELSARVAPLFQLQRKHITKPTSKSFVCVCDGGGGVVCGRVCLCVCVCARVRACASMKTNASRGKSEFSGRKNRKKLSNYVTINAIDIFIHRQLEFMT